MTIRPGTKPRRAWPLLVSILLAGCGHAGNADWHLFAYGDVMEDAPAQISGPYADAPRCMAAMRSAQALAQQDRVKQAGGHAYGQPDTAGFVCARGCTLSRRDAKGDLLTADCAQVLR